MRIEKASRWGPHMTDGDYFSANPNMALNPAINHKEANRMNV
jgi:hypothetical protein